MHVYIIEERVTSWDEILDFVFIYLQGMPEGQEDVGIGSVGQQQKALLPSGRR